MKKTIILPRIPKINVLYMENSYKKIVHVDGLTEKEIKDLLKYFNDQPEVYKAWLA